ncbi:hypothetical protein [Granulicella sp. L60]|uniref:hypothetical protein n=1 Tax=Granulicella sp. L60 TaxID=1641866 RepID=UPI00131D7DEA|nr:hypothetical protein [Granulicella sp. L60]
MQRVRSISVMQQAVICVVLGLVSAVIWFVAPLVRVHSGHAFALWFTLFAVTALGAFIASLWISYDLRTGIESERWPPEQIERFRVTFDTPLVVGVYATLTVAAMFFLSFDLMSHHHAHGSGYGLLLLTQNLSQLLMASRRPKSRLSGQRIDWRSAPPITSDHWGQHN